MSLHYVESNHLSRPILLIIPVSGIQTTVVCVVLYKIRKYFYLLPSTVLMNRGGGGGGGAELFMCPYPLKVQARLSRDQRLATQSRVSGGWRGRDEQNHNLTLNTISIINHIFDS